MALVERLTRGPRGALLIALLSAAILGLALASQYWGGLYPCVLCLYQRIPYWVTIATGALAAALIAAGRPRLGVALIAGCALAFVAGSGIAAHHIGVEQGWWQGSTACTGVRAGQAANVEELRRLLEQAPVVRCDEPAFTLFGVSMAGYNFVASFVLAAFAVASARTLLREMAP